MSTETMPGACRIALLRRHHRAEAKMLKSAAKAASREALSDDSDRIAAQVDATVAPASIASTLKSSV
jgi:hypothetical protein